MATEPLLMRMAREARARNGAQTGAPMPLMMRGAFEAGQRPTDEDDALTSMRAIASGRKDPSPADIPGLMFSHSGNDVTMPRKEAERLQRADALMTRQTVDEFRKPSSKRSLGPAIPQDSDDDEAAIPGLSMMSKGSRVPLILDAQLRGEGGHVGDVDAPTSGVNWTGAPRAIGSHEPLSAAFSGMPPAPHPGSGQVTGDVDAAQGPPPIRRIAGTDGHADTYTNIGRAGEVVTPGASGNGTVSSPGREGYHPPSYYEDLARNAQAAEDERTVRNPNWREDALIDRETARAESQVRARADSTDIELQRRSIMAQRDQFLDKIDGMARGGQLTPERVAELTEKANQRAAQMLMRLQEGVLAAEQRKQAPSAFSGTAE